MKLERLKKLRKRKRITQKQLAAEIGISVNALSMYERGLRFPRLKTLEKLAETLNCEIRDLI